MIQPEQTPSTEQAPMPDSHVVHLRIPDDIHAAILARAQAERRTWSQMAIILLEDAIEAMRPKRGWAQTKLRVASK